MAEETPKITTVGKVKDPRRVEQGKRLAAISREAKERKAKEREQHKVSESSESLWIIPVTVIVALCGGYYLFTKGKIPSFLTCKYTASKNYMQINILAM